jgi:hypothetical protein
VIVIVASCVVVPPDTSTTVAVMVSDVMLLPSCVYVASRSPAIELPEADLHEIWRASPSGSAASTVTFAVPPIAIEGGSTTMLRITGGWFCWLETGVPAGSSRPQ